MEVLIPDKDSYMEEVASIENQEVKDILIELYDHLEGSKKALGVHEKIEKVISFMFPAGGLFKEPVIPWSFLQGTIAKVIFGVMYSDPNDRLYTVQDIINITGFSKQNINSELKPKSGTEPRLKGTFKNGRWYFTLFEVNSFLKAKKLPPIE